MNVAIVQAHLEWENVPVNLKLFNKRIAAIEGANIIVLPEMFASGFTMKGKERVAPFYEAVYQCMQEWAREKDALIMGSTVYFEDEHYYNRLLVAFPDGKILHYDKKHLFTYGGEHHRFTAGRERVVVEFRGVRILLQICYDLRFPVWARNRKDYDVALYVASWPTPRVEAWLALLRARAIENQCYVAGVNRVGTDPSCEYCGGTLMIDPYGRTVAACEQGRVDAVTVEVDRDGLADFRRKFPVLDDADDFTLNI